MLLGSLQGVQAQGTAQVIVSGLPPVLPSPYLEDLERDYRQGRYITQFIFISPNRQPRSFQFLLTLERDGESLIEMTSEPVILEPGVHTYRTFDDEPAIRFPLSYGEWADLLAPGVSETGILAEGNYALRIEPIPTDPNAIIPSLPGVAYFSVQYTDPPLLLSPTDDVALTSPFPVFSWTPLTGITPGNAIEYELLIVEVLPGQAPYQALESNIEVVREVLVEQTSFVYTPNNLPLEPGKEYAWQVRTRDVAGRLPVLDQGDTEFYTFRVRNEGIGSTASSWSYPINAPFLEFDFPPDVDLEAIGSELYFDDELPIELQGISTTATFDALLVDTETQRIIDGSMTLNDPLAFEVFIDPLNDAFTGYRVVSPGSALSLTDGLLLELGGEIAIDAQGLHPRGSHPASVSYSGYGEETWTATYSDNFTFDFTPFSIAEGRVDFASDGVARAYADPTGFYLIDHGDPVIAQLPDRLLLPDPDMGYIPLKNAGQALVALEDAGSNRLRLRNLGNTPLELILSELQSTFQAQAPRFEATLEEVVIDAASGTMVEGTIAATLPGDGLDYTLDPLGIPIAPTAIRVEPADSGSFSSGSISLQIEGIVTLFGKAVEGSPPVRLSIGADRVARGDISIDADDASIWLDNIGQQVRLGIESATGFIEAPLASNRPARTRISIDGAIHVEHAGQTVAQTRVAFDYTGDGAISFEAIEPVRLDSPAPLPLEGGDLYIASIDRVNLFYSASTGLLYDAALTSSLQVGVGAQALSFPLSDARLSGNGLTLPEQVLHRAMPDFTPQEILIGENRLELLAVRLPASSVRLSSVAGQPSTPLEPYFDFEVQLDMFDGEADELAATPLTLQNARVTNGILEGAIYPFTFDEPVQWSFAAGEFGIGSISGSLSEEDENQRLLVRLNGSFELHLPDRTCTAPDLGLQVFDGQTIRGASSPFDLCDDVPVGPFLADLDESVLTLSRDSSGASFELSSERARLKTADASYVSESTGAIVLDLISGLPLDANFAVEEADLLFPTVNPQYRFDIKEAQLTEDGFSFPTDTSLTAYALEDERIFRLSTIEGFRLGWEPERQNQGSAELVPHSGEAQESGGRFDEAGYTPPVPVEDNPLPERLALPGGHGLYLDLYADGAPAVAITASNRNGTSIRTEDGEQALLVLDLFRQNDQAPMLPVALDLRVNAAMTYAGGSFEASYGDSPVDLTVSGYPVQITGIAYAEEEELQDRLRAAVRLPLPEPFQTESAFVEVEGVLTPAGFLGRIPEPEVWDIFPNTLAFTVDRVHLPRSQGASETEPASTVSFSGEIRSPLFGDAPQAALRYTATYHSERDSWTYRVDPVRSGVVPVGPSRLLLDQGTFDVDPEVRLALTGALVFPESIGSEFDLGVSLEFSQAGISVWQNDDLDDSRPLFGGFLDTSVEAVALRYDEGRGVITATLDGAFKPQIGEGSSASPDDVLPFSGMQLRTDGTVSLNENMPSDSLRGGTIPQRINLLENLSPLSVVSDAYSIESILLSADSLGLALDLSGTVRLPAPSARPADRSALRFATLPAHLSLDARGGIRQAQSKWDEAQLDSLLQRSLLQQNNAHPAGAVAFKYTSAALDFDPLYPARARMLASAQLLLPQPIRAGSIGASSLPDVVPFEENVEGDSTQAIPSRSSDVQNRNIQSEVVQYEDTGLRAPSESTGTISLGHPSDPEYHPGVIAENQHRTHYLLTDAPSGDRPLFDIASDLTRIEVTSISLPDPYRPDFLISGQAQLAIDGFSGYFPVKDLRVNTAGIRSLGTSAGPGVFAYQNIASFEVGCFDYDDRTLTSSPQSSTASRAESGPSSPPGARPVTGPLNARLRFGRVCGSPQPITLTDRWLSGTYEDFSVLSNESGNLQIQFSGMEADIAGLAALSASMTLERSDDLPLWRIDGNTRYRNVDLVSTGTLKQVDGQPSLGILFNPPLQPMDLLPGLVGARVAGGGLFYRPSPSDVDLVSLVLNERTNNGFSSNHPDADKRSPLEAGNKLHLFLPVEVTVNTGQEGDDFEGVGLFDAAEQRTTLDISGTFLGDSDELDADLYLVNRRHEEDAEPGDPTTLEGIAQISLNYQSVVGGVLKTNAFFRTDRSLEEAWYATGRSRLLIADAVDLPGGFVLTPSGFALQLNDAVQLDTDHLSVTNELGVSLWKERATAGLEGYMDFEASIDLVPGFMLMTTQMHGGLLEDREEQLLYAATNLYADVPFVFTGPIDPWLSLQDGNTYGGDARNTTFRRMVLDARQIGREIPAMSAQATEILRQALDVQQELASTPVVQPNLPVFVQPDSTLDLLGDRLLGLETANVDESELAPIFRAIAESLFVDNQHPDYGLDAVPGALTRATASAYEDMTASIDRARRAAELDIYSLQALAARPLIWTSDYVELAPELTTSPLSALTLQPGEDRSPSFEVDPSVSQLQRSSLLAFKQNNEAVDSQFLRAISGLEINLVNLKTTRSPEQAIEFNNANRMIQRFYASQIADDWTMMDWSSGKKAWLENQEQAIDQGIQDLLGSIQTLDESERILRESTQRRYDLATELARHTAWSREDLPEDQSYLAYLSALDEAGLQEEFVKTVKDLWYDIPLTALTATHDSIAVLREQRYERFEAGLDTLNKVTNAFSRSLDPLYDSQTLFTTTLYGMAEEYREWRSSIRGLDPAVVDLSFQFAPYRGNYRILAEDLIPPVIDEIRILPSRDGYLSQTDINWSTDHPVELSETSISILQGNPDTTYFSSLAAGQETTYYTTKPDADTDTQTIHVTLRARGAGGVPAFKMGQFTVAVDPDEPAAEYPEEGLPLVPVDPTPPPAPVISGLTYTSYFSETPNTLRFMIDALRDEESGIERIEYNIENRQNDETLQDWTTLPISTNYFVGRLVETGLPVQEEDIDIQVTVRAINGSGLSSETVEELSLDLDDTPPSASIRELLYFNLFDRELPHSLSIEIGDIEDQESGIERIEYTITRDAEANLANAIWADLVALNSQPLKAGAQSVNVQLDDMWMPDDRTVISLFMRVTNGAGLQTVVSEAIELPGQDSSPPTEPTLQLEHTGVYDAEAPNHLRIILGGSRDFESSLEAITFRVIDGQTGQAIYPWDDFIFLDPNAPTYILPATERRLPLPAFESGRSIIVEAQARNRAGLSSIRTRRFLPLELDVTPPTAPATTTQFFPPTAPVHPNTIQLEVGPIEDPQSPIASVEFRFIDVGSQQTLQDWQPLSDSFTETGRFPGAVRYLDASFLPPGVDPVLQVRATNLQGLTVSVNHPVEIDSDVSAPIAPSLSLGYIPVRGATSDQLQIDIGRSADPQSNIAGVRYRIRPVHVQDSLILDWSDIEFESQFLGASFREDIPELIEGHAYIVDVDVFNGSGLSTRVSAIMDYEMSAFGQDLALQAPEVSLFHYDATHSVRPNQLEIAVSSGGLRSTQIDSIRYRIELLTEQGDPFMPGDSTLLEPVWQSIADPTESLLSPRRFYFGLPYIDQPVQAVVSVELLAPEGVTERTTEAITLSVDVDDTPPPAPMLDAIYYGYHHPVRANELDLLIDEVTDAESRIAEVSYRVIDEQNGEDVVVDWTAIDQVSPYGIFEATLVPIELPEFGESASLSVEVRAINGARLPALASVDIEITVDTTPPDIAEPALSFRPFSPPADSVDLILQPGPITDQESEIESAEYRVLVEEDSTRLIRDWTPLHSEAAHTVLPLELTVPLPYSSGAMDVRVEIRARNYAGLTDSRSTELVYEVDDSPPQIQPFTASFERSPVIEDYLLVEPGTFRDPDSEVESVAYRIVDAADDSTVYVNWTSIPVLRTLRASVDPIAIPRSKLPFRGAKEVHVELRAVNGAGLSGRQHTRVAIPGDDTPPEEPTLILTHRNAYDPLHPNTLEIQIGSSTDEQSDVIGGRYRIVYASDGEVMLPWTNLHVSSEGFFPGTVLFNELPFIESDTVLRLELEIDNSAGLVRRLSEDVTIHIERDLSPPSVAIDLYYFSEEIAIVINELADAQSKIQRVEYRFLDNVDQSVIEDWTELFEIQNPLDDYSQQSHKVPTPEVRADRTLKVDVRATNGAGLQTTVSRTLQLQ